MPYYRWKGVALDASYCKGTSFARTIDELEHILLRHDIALVSIKKGYNIIPMPIKRSDVIDVFKQLTLLLQSGILLPQALQIVAEQAVHSRLQKILFNMVDLVTRGITFSDALCEYPQLFSTVMVHMVRVGQASGCMANALDALVMYLEMVQSFNAKIRQAALMPAISLFAFFAIGLGVIIGIVPRFASFFSSMGKELPYVTQCLLIMSDWLQMPMAWMGIFVLSGGLFLVWRLVCNRWKQYIDTALVALPFVGNVILQRSLLYWMHALAMLLKSRVPLVQSLRIVHPLVHNEYVRTCLETIADDVAAGNTLRSAMVSAKNQPFNPEVLALIQVGQESGSLGIMVEKSARMYQSMVDEKLALCTVMIQPLLLVILGLLVAFLVFALYMPIFNLAQVA